MLITAAIAGAFIMIHPFHAPAIKDGDLPDDDASDISSFTSEENDIGDNTIYAEITPEVSEVADTPEVAAVVTEPEVAPVVDETVDASVVNEAADTVVDPEIAADNRAEPDVPTVHYELKEIKYDNGDVGYKILGPRHRDINIPWLDSLDALRALNVPNTTSDGWVPAPQTQETVCRIFPHIKSKFDVNINNYKILFAFQQDKGNGVVAIKGALQHKTTGCITMLTAHNSPTGVNKPKPAHAEGWTVFGVDMIAPACFWNAFKAC